MLLSVFVLVFLLAPMYAARAASPAMMPSPISSRDEVHQYSVLVKDNGSANAFLLVSNLGDGGKGGNYRLTLPEGAIGPVKAWYVDEGVFQKCIQPLMEGSVNDALYPRVPCYEAVRIWAPIENITEEGDSITVTIPKTKGHISLGITWKMTDVTDRKWWGRKVTISTPSVDHFVSFIDVSVDFPDGVYVRDKAVGPTNWGDMTTGVTMSVPGAGLDEKMVFSPEMFERGIGAGDVVKSKSNLAPGETYSFSLLTATARWKLFVPEIATMLGVAIALALVVSLLLRLLIGRKPFWWYLAVVSLLLLLAGLVLWLFRMYTALFPRTDYPVMYEKTWMLDAGEMESTAVPEGAMVPKRLEEPVNFGQ